MRIVDLSTNVPGPINLSDVRPENIVATSRQLGWKNVLVEPVYKRQRLGGSYSASPWAYDGKVFCLSEDGTTRVIKAGSDFEVLGKNSMNEVSLATPALSGPGMLLRTQTKLYCVQLR